MSDAWMNRIKNIHFILFDYTALFEMGRFPVLDELADTCVSQNIQVVISASFQFYHTCVIRAASEEDMVCCVLKNPCLCSLPAIHIHTIEMYV
jgi:hypothetical protein